MSPAVWGWLGWWFAIGGAVLVGLGGLLATLGWNKLQAYHQWRNTIVGVMREVELNDRMIEAAMDLAQRWPSRSKGESFSHEDYHSSHVTAAVTSGLLSAKDPEDREVRDVLEAYERSISRFNAALRIVGSANLGLFLRPDLIHVSERGAWPPNTQDTLAAIFIGLLQAHETARDTLRRQYPWAKRKYS
jgi:hypothetical protein